MIFLITACHHVFYYYYYYYYYYWSQCTCLCTQVSYGYMIFVVSHSGDLSNVALLWVIDPIFLLACGTVPEIKTSAG